MAKPAASEEEVEVKPKKPIVKIILALVGLVVLISVTMLGTLYLAGFFKPPPSAEQAADEEGGQDKHGAEADKGKKADDGHGKPAADAGKGKKADDGHGKPEADKGKKPDAKPGAEADKGKKPDAKADAKPGAEAAKLSKKSPNSPRFDYTYHQLSKEFLVNLTGSRKVMSVQVAIMTRYDERVVENVKKHEFALRSVVMDVMRQTTEADLPKPDFRKELAVKIRDAMNTLIEKYEDFGGIEDVYFTSFIVQ
jgi:flagellar FliL protein